MFALFTPAPRHCATTPAHPAPVLDLQALAGAAAWARLPAAVQRRFGTAHADVSYHGHLDLRCSLIGHIYAALTRPWGGPLTHIHTTALPATVHVSHNGRGGVVWERCFHTGTGATNDNGTHTGADRTVRSTKELGADGTLLERTDGGLAMSLDVLEEDGALVFRSRRFWWVVAGLRIPVPTLLTPGTCRVAHTDLGGGQFRFTLSMVHPLWGETFHQSGVFTDPVVDTTTEYSTTPVGIDSSSH
ncbi:hypothetical protein ASF11_16970 [Acidovorax sp. Leaf76]|uniref:DUF4166 domain-containing protein n=1 Tax=unclassified Acidovorax TaxID=2684926 RepID=UPI0006FF5A7F|nr:MULTISPECIES: DUF4166 domain-containing protein [unclassified Acidovorax]KQO12234.1 hypothetical protein ASF11_16970 [Acidovorax sp. Leaf76]KQO29199.1 hypothetical protein ASF19_15920 [Acidovorax sp. Leaf84]KQS25721.1 hypothetical protein ASG27_18295 [Acidovorax sp. Leaf191]